MPEKKIIENLQDYSGKHLSKIGLEIIHTSII
jgi:hypothetical protein